jgi:hypothetical protein
MNVDKILEKVGSPTAPKSPGQDLFGQHLRREITREEYLELNAIHAADLCHEAKPAIYFPLSQVLHSYVECRLQGIRGRDREIGAKLGHWSGSVRSALEKNLAEIEHLLWAKSICGAYQAVSQVHKLENALRRFSMAKPPDVLNDVIEVQKMDIRDRLTEEGR